MLQASEIEEWNDGEPVRDAPDVIDLDISGMSCAACAGRVEKALLAVPGVRSAVVNPATDRAHVEADPASDGPQVLIDAVAAAGYGAALPGQAEEPEATGGETAATPPSALLWRDDVQLVVAALCSVPFLVQMLAMMTGLGWHMPPLVEFLLATPVQLWAGARFYAGSYRALRDGAANMDVLVALGTSAAYAYSIVLWLGQGGAAAGHLYFEAAVLVVTLVLAGKQLEARAKRGAAGAIRALQALRPDVATVLRDGAETDVPIDQVASGDTVLVRPGQRIPVDGVVIEGESEADESLVTGESLPVVKRVDSAVIGGSVNGAGLLTLQATSVGAESMLARVIRLVETAQGQKPPVQRLVDRVSAVFVPVVVGVALTTFILWLAFGGSLEQALVASVSVLVIACPCALGLATPTAIVAGTGAAARSGIVVRAFDALERAAHVDTVAFDKTGTLTEGRPAIDAVVPTEASGLDEDELVRLAASAQSGSEHPLARAFADRAESHGLALDRAQGFLAHVGRGITATVGRSEVAVGNQSLMAELEIDVGALDDSVAAREQAGHTTVIIARDGEPLGIATIADPVREVSGRAITRLHERGISTVLLSGDAATVAGKVAGAVGIDRVLAPVRPADKSGEIERLRETGAVVAMVGDGINDAPALAAADVGIAMGTGTDVAMETAGLTLMRPDPRLVEAALDISTRTIGLIRQNLFWAFIYNVVCIPLAALGYLNPALAGAAMALSSVSVVMNSLRLTRWRPASA